MNSARKFSKWLPDNSTNLTWINSVVVLGVLLKSLKCFKCRFFIEAPAETIAYCREVGLLLTCRQHYAEYAVM